METPVIEMKPSQLLQELIDRARTPGGYGTRRCDELEQEILRRMAW